MLIHDSSRWFLDAIGFLAGRVEHLENALENLGALPGTGDGLSLTSNGDGTFTLSSNPPTNAYTKEGSDASFPILDSNGKVSLGVIPDEISNLINTDEFVKKVETYIVPNTTTSYRTINLGYLTDPNESPDIERVYIQNVLSTWRNEWGALRGTPSLGLKDDALVRGVARNDLGPTAAGGFIELVNRTFPTGDVRRQSFQVRWRDGALMRNNTEMSLCYVRYGASPLPDHLPEGTVVVTVND